MLRIDKNSKIFIGIILGIAAFIAIIPFLWMILSAFKPNAEIVSLDGFILPRNWTFKNFKELFYRLNFGTYFKNTLIVTLLGFVGLFLNVMCGYGFARYDFKHKRFLFLAVLATMMIPGQVTMIPAYLILNSLNLTNTYLGMVLPTLANGFTIFLFRQFFSRISEEILDAARIDGAGEFRTFFNIALPLSKPILAVQIILTFIGGWNSFLWPLITASDQSYYTLSVGLQLLQGQHASDYGLQMAGSAFMVIPILIIFLVFQKYLLEGFDLSGNK